MKTLLPILCFIVALVVSVSIFPEGATAILLCIVTSSVVVWVLKSFTNSDEKDFLVQLFLVSLLLRVILATCIYNFNWQDFFGPDSWHYDALGSDILQSWLGKPGGLTEAEAGAGSLSGSGWGMGYIVAVVYLIAGKNQLAVQFLSAVIGAATAPAIYICSHKIFQSKRVAKISAIIVAVAPSLVLWTSQMLKDGFIIFLLVMIMIAVLNLQEKFSYGWLFGLIGFLFGILSLRFYIFFMVAIAVTGGFIIGTSNSAKSMARQLIVLVLLGLALTYIGVLRNAGEEFNRYGSLEQLQRSRSDLATAGSGFGEDVDVGTTSGAIAALPIGFTYLMLAPFPWQITNFRQLITLPEMLLWWGTIPILISGLWYTIKNRLRNAIAVLIFTLMLTLAYSVFQGNVGTAYRQRAQIQVFLFIFSAVGWTLIREKRENQALALKAQRNKAIQRQALLREQKEI